MNAVDRIKKAGGVQISLAEEGIEYHPLNRGEPVSRATIELMLHNGQLVPVDDGLLSDAPQTYRYVAPDG
mgnify:CR=1 FL=1